MRFRFLRQHASTAAAESLATAQKRLDRFTVVCTAPKNPASANCGIALTPRARRGPSPSKQAEERHLGPQRRGRSFSGCFDRQRVPIRPPCSSQPLAASLQERPCQVFLRYQFGQSLSSNHGLRLSSERPSCPPWVSTAGNPPPHRSELRNRLDRQIRTKSWTAVFGPSRSIPSANKRMVFSANLAARNS